MKLNELDRHLKPILELAIREDISSSDITTKAMVREPVIAQGGIIAKDKAILCGLPMVDYIFNYHTDSIKNSKFFFPEGATVHNGDKVYEVTGEVSRLLSYERIALNLLQHLSGIASKSREFVEALNGLAKPSILDTRKTLPGYRALEKYAVKIGGANNHRQGLYDMFLIKDNHIQLAGSVTQAIKRVRTYANDSDLKHLSVEVECKSLEQVKEAAEQSADIIMLDNMPDSSIRQAVKLIPSGIKIEVSGRVSVSKIPTLARLEVDFISCGALTHSANAKDFSMQIHSSL